MEKMTLKLVFLVALTVVAFCSSLSDARHMPLEVNCIGKCPPASPNCNCMSPIALMDDAKEMSKDEPNCIGKCPPNNPNCNCMSMPPIAPMDDAEEMPKEEVNCIGKCPPDNPNCNCMPSPPTPPPVMQEN